MRRAVMSVDLDEIEYYHQIHGLPGAAPALVYEVALPRMLAFAARLQLPMTLFAIGRDLTSRTAREALAQAAHEGHEIGNHSLDHRYDLSRLPRDQVRAQIEGGARAIAEVTGERPVGFRAPGYTITDEMFTVLSELGYRYDSSVFPCPTYYSAKALAISAIALRGRRSHSVVDSPRVLTAPTRPYRVGRPYTRRARPGEGRLLELPIQVTRGLRLPYIGTSLLMAGRLGAQALTAMCVGEPLVNLELHGIDWLEADDGLTALRPHQPDVRVPLADKLAIFEAVVASLRARGYTFTTLAEAADASELR